VDKAPPDGYTLHLTSNSFVLGPLLRKQLPYDPFADFIALTQVAQTPNILLVGPNLGVKDLKGYLELAKGGKLQYASSGRGTPSHITVELFKAMANVSIEEIPYKSSAQALTDTISGQISLNAPGIAQGLPFVRSGRAVALGITGSKRAPGAQDIPTLAEAGVPGYEAYGWHGIFAPAKTPPDLARFLESELRAVLSTAEARETFGKSGAEIVAGTSADFTAFLRTDFAKWQKLFGQLGIKPE
jgi:tripartite-type tricarboxylate transporter receptor subunit TctC